MACLLKNEPASYTVQRVSSLRNGATAKASLNRASSPSGDTLHRVDPKPGELSMARVQVR